MDEEAGKFGDKVPKAKFNYQQEHRRRGDLAPFTKNIGYMVVLAFIGITVGLLWPTFSTGKAPSDVSIYMLGNLAPAAMAVLYFLYGSSDGSKKKSDEIANIQNKEEKQ